MLEQDLQLITTYALKASIATAEAGLPNDPKPAN